MKEILGQCSHFMILFETALFRTAVPAYAIEYSHFHRLSRKKKKKKKKKVLALIPLL